MLTNLPTVEQVLNDHASVLGHDRIAYRNHAYRVANLCLAIGGDSPVELEKLAAAAVFHDLGIPLNPLPMVKWVTETGRDAVTARRAARS